MKPNDLERVPAADEGNVLSENRRSAHWSNKLNSDHVERFTNKADHWSKRVLGYLLQGEQTDEARQEILSAKSRILPSMIRSQTRG